MCKYIGEVVGAKLFAVETGFRLTNCEADTEQEDGKMVIPQATTILEAIQSLVE